MCLFLSVGNSISGPMSVHRKDVFFFNPHPRMFFKLILERERKGKGEREKERERERGREVEKRRGAGRRGEERCVALFMPSTADWGLNLQTIPARPGICPDGIKPTTFSGA